MSVRARRFAGGVAALVVLIVLAAASMALGSKDIPIERVLPALLHPSHQDDALVITQLRLPRTILALLVGVALAVAGALIQAYTRNPLADPGILGVNAGAALAVALGVTLLGMSSITQYLWLALGGAIVATLLVTLIGALGRAGATPVRVTLAGVGIGAVLSGVTSALSLTNPTAFSRLLGWSAGSVTGPPLATAGVITPVIGVGVLVAILLARDLNALALGDELAAALGSRAALTRGGVIVAITLLCGAATAAAGPIGFVGLMIPHVARWIVGPDQRWILAFSIVLGPCLVLASDVIGRLVLRPAELPVGVVTAFVGAPVLILLARRAKASGL